MNLVLSYVLFTCKCLQYFKSFVQFGITCFFEHALHSEIFITAETTTEHTLWIIKIISLLCISINKLIEWNYNSLLEVFLRYTTRFYNVIHITKIEFLQKTYSNSFSCLRYTSKLSLSINLFF